MTGFSLRNPYFIVVLCLMVVVVGTLAVVSMPVDLFPTINLPQVVVATFYSGMPPEEMEAEITSPLERFFTLGSGIDHIESRSLPGVSVIRVFFQAGTNADTDVTTISNLALADLRRLPPGTLPPVVLKSDASSLPVTLVTLQGQGLDETQLHDVGQFVVRNQLALVPGASVPWPFGGKYRQVMVYVDPLKLDAYQLSPMDVVRAINATNLILPAGDAKIGPYDYNIYSNSQIEDVHDIDNVPLKTIAQRIVTVGDIGHAEDASAIQTNIVRVNGQRSSYLPVLKQGGDTNTIAVVQGVKNTLQHLVGVPHELVTRAVFDQSQFVEQAIRTLVHEGISGLLLTALMILIFLGSLRATAAVFLSIPLSALAAFILLQATGNSINAMILSGLALVFSRLIDNSVIVLENIFRHMEMGETPAAAALQGGEEVALAVLAATLTTAVVFFPVVFLNGVSRFLFSALALSVVLALFASYFVAISVVPLFCANLIRGHGHSEGHESEHGRRPPRFQSLGQRFNTAFNRGFDGLLRNYERAVELCLRRPAAVVVVLLVGFGASLLLFPLLGLAYFPRTDAGQFVINMHAPSGTRVEVTEQDVERVEAIVHQVVAPSDLNMIVSNIGIVPDFSAIYTTNSGPDTATVQVALKEGHRISSFEYMDRVRKALAAALPQVRTFFQSGSLQDAVLNQGAPAPIDVQVSGQNLEAIHDVTTRLADKIRQLPGVEEAYVPQALNYPSLRLDVDRGRAAEVGMSQQGVVDNVITALTSSGMISPSYWVDPKSGIDYLLAVQYEENNISAMSDLNQIPLRGVGDTAVRLDAVGSFAHTQSATEVDHDQIQRINDIYVNPAGEDLSRVANEIDRTVAAEKPPEGVGVQLHGLVLAMRTSFSRFAVGLMLAVLLLYLVLVAQFRSFLDPILILLAVPLGVTGVIVTLLMTGTTINIQSLMGVIMMVGIVTSNSILIVEFTHRLRRDQGQPLRQAVVAACRIRLRPILMTSLATIIGLLPMALKIGEGSEAYAPLARAIIGGMVVSVALTVFIVPAAYVWAYDHD